MEPSCLHTAENAAALMKVIGGAQRLGAFGKSFRVATGGGGEADAKSGFRGSGGELGVSTRSNSVLNSILPNTQSINGLKRVSQLCPRMIRHLESNGVT